MVRLLGQLWTYLLSLFSRKIIRVAFFRLSIFVNEFLRVKVSSKILDLLILAPEEVRGYPSHGVGEMYFVESALLEQSIVAAKGRIKG